METIFMYINWSPTPYLVDLGFLKIHYYSLCWILAFIIGWYVMLNVFKTDRVDTKLIDPLFLYTFIGTIAGARLGEYLFYDVSAFWETPVEVFLPVKYSPGASVLFGLLQDYEFSGFSGLASHGAAVGMLISTYLFNRKYLKGNLIWLMDRIVLTIPIGGAAIRIGNFINSEIVGKPSDLPWAVLFKQQSLGYGEIVPRHPSQLYEAVGYLIIFVIIWYIYKKTDKKRYLGFIFGLFLVMLWMVRFIVEFFKENQGTEDVAQAINIGLNNGQVLSIPFIIAGLIIIITSKNRVYKSS